MSLTDARGVTISPGDSVIYGFGVGRGLAMAEGVVLGEEGPHRPIDDPRYPDRQVCACDWGEPFNWPCPVATPSVSLTPSGRVRIRNVRKADSIGEGEFIVVAPDRLVVLKTDGIDLPFLPPSPLPLQDEQQEE